VMLQPLPASRLMHALAPVALDATVRVGPHGSPAPQQQLELKPPLFAALTAASTATVGKMGMSPPSTLFAASLAAGGFDKPGSISLAPRQYTISATAGLPAGSVLAPDAQLPCSASTADLMRLDAPSDGGEWAGPCSPGDDGDGVAMDSGACAEAEAAQRKRKAGPLERCGISSQARARTRQGAAPLGTWLGVCWHVVWLTVVRRPPAGGLQQGASDGSLGRRPAAIAGRRGYRRRRARSWARAPPSA
jgi:hypothetical protein